MKPLRICLHYADKLCCWFIIIGLSVMTLVLFAQVAVRYLFDGGISWSEELARYIMIWVVYLGAAVVYRDNSHISVTALEEFVGPKARFFLNVVQKLISMGFIGLMGYYASGTLEFAAIQTSPNMMIPMNYIYIVFPLSSLLIILHLALSLVDDFSGRSHIPSPEEKEAREVGMEHPCGPC